MNVIYTELLPEGITMKFNDGTIFIGIQNQNKTEEMKKEEQITGVTDAAKLLSRSSYE